VSFTDAITAQPTAAAAAATTNNLLAISLEMCQQAGSNSTASRAMCGCRQ